MSTRRLLIRNGDVLIGPPRSGVVRPADVLVENGRIRAIERDLRADDVEVVDAEGCFVLPGFVDAHRHLWQTTMRALTADYNLMDYFWCIRRNHAVVHGPDDVYAGTYVGALEAVASGVTCSIDFSHCIITPEHADEAIRGIRESGIRALWCYGFYAPPVEEGPTFAGPEERLHDARRVRAGYFSSGDGRVRMGVALNELGLVPLSVTRNEVALAQDLQVPVTAHTNCVWRSPNVTEVEILHSAGLLGANQVHAHCNTSTGRELDLLRDAGAGVAATPETELGMGMGFPILGRAAEHGLLPALGADIHSNNRGDLFTQMRLGLQAERTRVFQPVVEKHGMEEMGPVSMTVRDILHFATQGGAEVLGLGSVCGSLDVGKAADVVLLRHDRLHMRPVVDPVATIVLHAGVDDVDTVTVDGTIVKRGGKLVGHDERRAIRLIDEAHARIAARVAERGGWNPTMPDGLAGVVTKQLRTNLGE